MAYELDDGDDTGVSIGQSSSSLVGFHGATPAGQMTYVASVTGTFSNILTALNQIRADLITKGLMASS